MLAEERRQKINLLLQKRGKIRIEELCELFSVTSETIRRDLNILEQKNVLKKVHGGAILPMQHMKESSFTIRYAENLKDKQIIAELASRFIHKNETLLLDASTSAFCLAEKIESYSEIMIITHSLKILETLSYGSPKVIGLGGELDSTVGAFIGTQTLSAIENLYATHGFISCNGLDAKLGILDITPAEAAIKEKILHHSSKRYLLIDSSKLKKVGLVRIKHIDMIDYFITNTCPSKEWLKFFKDQKGKLLYPENFSQNT